MTTSNRLLNFKNINREKYEYLEPEKSENGSYVSSCVYNLDGETKLGYYFECPRVVTPTGVYKSGGKYMMDVIIPLGSSLLEYLLSEDETNMKATSMNSEDWFGEHFPLEVVQEKYNSALVFQNGNPILKLCIPTYQGKPMCEVFDNNRNLVNTSNIKNGSEVALILEKVGLRFLKETFVGEYTAHKIKVFNSQKLNQLPEGYLFGEEEEETKDEELEREEEQEEELEGEELEGEELEGEEELELELEGEEVLEEESEESEEEEEELLSEDESEFGDQLTDEELELEFSEDEGLTSELETEEEKDEELEQDLQNMENELEELELNPELVTAEGGESEELETGDELEFNPAELTDEELEIELSEESESEEGAEFNPAELTDEELELDLESMEEVSSEETENAEVEIASQELETENAEVETASQELETENAEVEVVDREDELILSPELEIDLEEENLVTPSNEEPNTEDELELSSELDVELEEQDLKTQIRDDVSQKSNSMNVEELKDEDLELEMSLS
jgi:hypothetical protein